MDIMYSVINSQKENFCIVELRMYLHIFLHSDKSYLRSKMLQEKQTDKQTNKTNQPIHN